MNCTGSWDGAKAAQAEPFSNALADWLTRRLPEWRGSGWKPDPDSERIMGAKDATYTLTDSRCDEVVVERSQNVLRALPTSHGNVRLSFFMASAFSCTPGESGGTGRLKPDAGAPDIPRLEATSACLGRSDEAMCLLKVEAGKNSGEDLICDLHFVAHPEVLTAVGVDAAAIDRWVRAGRPSAEPETLIIGRPDYDVRKAVWNVISLDRAGAPPDQAIRPAIDLKSPFADTGSLTPGQVSPERLRTIRLQSFGRLWDLAHDQRRAVPGVRPSDGLIRATLAAWEMELSAAPTEDNRELGLVDLAKKYEAIGDSAGMQRTLALISSDDHFANVERLILLDRLDEAAATAVHPDLAGIKVSIIKAHEAELKHNDRLMQQVESQMANALTAVYPDKASTPEGKKALDALRHPPLVPAGPDFTTTTAFKEEVNNIIENARDAVVKAAVAAHRYDLASDVAKVLLDDPRAWGWASDTLPILARYGKPDVAAHEISMLEQRLANHEPYNQLELTRLDILFKAWLALGRADEAQALLEYWMPKARAEAKAYRDIISNSGELTNVKPDTVSAVTYLLLQEDKAAEAQALGYVSPAELLEIDIHQGRGLRKLTVYLPASKRSIERQLLWQDCARDSAFAKLWADAETCVNREASLATSPEEKSDLVQNAFLVASQAANAGEVRLARDLLALGLRVINSVPVGRRSQTFAFAAPGGLDSTATEVAEAELQANSAL